MSKTFFVFVLFHCIPYSFPLPLLFIHYIFCHLSLLPSLLTTVAYGLPLAEPTLARDLLLKRDHFFSAFTKCMFELSF